MPQVCNLYIARNLQQEQFIISIDFTKEQWKSLMLTMNTVKFSVFLLQELFLHQSYHLRLNDLNDLLVSEVLLFTKNF